MSPGRVACDASALVELLLGTRAGAAVYVALAEALDAVLIAADRRLANAVAVASPVTVMAV